jgi:hypothetical protein
MERAKGRSKIKGVHDSHHILPKSLGGSNSKQNRVFLTYKEHFIAHWILALITEGASRRKMLTALQSMSLVCKNNASRTPLIWQYVLGRRAQSEAMIGRKLALGRKQTVEARLAIGRANKNNTHCKGYTWTDDQLASLRGGNNHGARPVRCLNDNRVFQTASEASEFYGVHHVGKVCKGRRETTGKRKYPGGLRFEFIEKPDAD